MELLIPTIDPDLENMKLPSPELVEYYSDLEKREMWINYDIDDSLFDLTKNIYRYNKEDMGIPVSQRKPIYVYVFSYGGEVENCLAFVSAILASKTPVITVNCGIAMSCGALIFLAGQKRYMTKLGTVLIHNGSSSGGGGTYEQNVAQQENYNATVDKFKKYILERTNIDPKVYNKHRSKEWYLYADDCIKYGIATDLIENIEDIY